MDERLIVGFDGSDASKAAIRWAAAEAELLGASVRVVCSCSIPVLADPYGMAAAYMTPSDTQQVKDGWMTQLRAAVTESETDHPEVGFDYAVVDEEAATLLLGEAAEGSLIIVGSSGAGAVKSFLLGSVTSAVLHRSPWPVVVMPTKMHDTTGVIAVGIDGSEASNEALRWATDEVERRGVELHVIHAWEYPYVATTTGRDFAEVDAGGVLEAAVRLARDRCVGNVHGMLVEGNAVQILLDASDTADLVVVGSRGRGGFRAMLFGSVAHGVAAHASSPVVVIG